MGVARKQHAFVDKEGNRYVAIGTDKFLIVYFEGQFFDVTPLSNNPNESYTRNPDLTGPFEQHNGVSGTLYSPGTRTDGSPF